MIAAPRRSLARVLAGLALGALAVGGCGDDRRASPATTTTTVATTSTTPTTAAATREDYIRQGDAVCADSNAKIDAVPPPATDAPEAEFDRYNQHTEALVREFVAAFKAVPAPPADRATAERLHASADEILAKEVQFTAAERTGDEAALDKAEVESEAAWQQFIQLARSYGFVECAKDIEPPEPAQEGPAP